jgi:phage shock protein PspC (stress-responsive transcriptional regulator)
MKDIVRIHIAKVPYSIEVQAKEKLEEYMADVEAYTNDGEILDDVEARITELLLERSVKREDVISHNDVQAIRKQLGDPKEFMSDESVLEIEPERLSNEVQRKLYRNQEMALLGGVLSGIATYFRVTVLWIRLAFIIGSFISFGFFVVLYFVLWFVIPPARTAAEKLQLAGKAVTLASIREFNSSDSSVNVAKRTRTQKRIVTILAGLVSVGGVLISIAALAIVAIEMVRTYNSDMYNEFSNYGFSMILLFSSGILLSMLFVLTAYASFAQRFNKRIWISGIVIIVLGIGTFTTGVIGGVIQNDTQYKKMLRNTVNTSIVVPEGFAIATKLKVDVPESVTVKYVVDDRLSSIKHRALRGSDLVKVSVENAMIEVNLASTGLVNRIADNVVTLYGPRIESIIVSSGNVTYSVAKQSDLKTEVYNSSSLRLIESRIGTVETRTDGVAQFSADESAVELVKASLYAASSVDLGNIRALEIVSSDVCASSKKAQITIGSTTASTYILNDKNTTVQSVEYPCIDIEFDDDQFDD